MKYKIGDKVRIKDKFWELETDDTPGILDTMKKCVGMILEVDRIGYDSVIKTKQRENCGIDTNWVWHPTWVEPVEELTMEEVCKELGRTIKIKK